MNSQTLLNMSDIVVEETVNLFLTACEMNLSVCDCNIQAHLDAALISMIRLEGDLNCSFFLCIPQETAEEVAPRFLEIEIPFDSDDMNDIVGELNNMLCGSMKTALSLQGFNIKINVPTIQRLQSLRQLRMLDLELITTSFTSPQGKLWTGFVEDNKVR
ncbi:MAG: chemotaxis protein CheX [Planctomycetota bacterium]